MLFTSEERVMRVNTNLYQEEINGVTEWIQHEYDTRFASYFKDVRNMFKRLQSETKPITDDELNWIMINLPMVLFDVSEKVSELQVALEIVRLRCKEQETELIQASKAKTITQKKAEAALQLAEPNAIQAVYQAVIDRVTREITFSKELIMGAKKVWDRRKNTEQSMPVSVGQIPTYKTPIFGSDQV